MRCLLSHTTALEVLRRAEAPRLIERGQVRREDRAPDAVPGTEEVATRIRRLNAVSAASAPLHLLVRDAGARLFRADVHPHVFPHKLPSGATFALSEEVSCSSPELVALQMAEYATDLELLLLVDELCGLFAIQPAARSGLVQRRSPITTVEKIAALLDALPACRGSARLRRALADARPLSASPRESMTVHRLEFAPRRGGYGLPVVALNDEVAVERADALLAGGVRRVRKPDIMMLALDERAGERVPFYAVAIDYKGSWHRDPAQEARDVDRRNELLARGVKDYELDAGHYASLDYMDWLARSIRRDLGLAEPRRTRATEESCRERRALLAERISAVDGLSWHGRQTPLLMMGP